MITLRCVVLVPLQSIAAIPEMGVQAAVPTIDIPDGRLSRR